MNRLVLVPIALAAAAAPAAALLLAEPDADALGKEFAARHPGATVVTHVTEEALSEQDEIGRAEAVIEGTVVDARPFWRVLGDPEYPRIFTEYAVRVDGAIKGGVGAGQTISVMLPGGALDGVTARSDAPILEAGDRVIMLLGRDPASIWGGSYHPVSVTKSTYVIEGGIAKNALESRTMARADLVERLARMSGG